jgi:hypothetical protein
MSVRLARWLKTAPVDWHKRTEQYFHQPERIDEIRQICSEIDTTMQRSAMLRAYLETRLGLDGTGAHPHKDGVKEANRLLVKIRRALGYTYPKRGTFPF